MFWFKIEGFEQKTENLHNHLPIRKSYNQLLKLNQDEKGFLKNYYPQMKKLDVYEYSEMKKILQDIVEKNTSENIEKWRNEMENALSTCNETKYQYLMGQLV